MSSNLASLHECFLLFPLKGTYFKLFSLYRFIIWRKANQIAMKLAVQPREGCNPDEEIVIGFSLQYTYVNTVVEKSSTPTKGPQKQALTSRVYIKLGKLSGNDAESP